MQDGTREAIVLLAAITAINTVAIFALGLWMLLGPRG
jgi:hypothetical protein